MFLVALRATTSSARALALAFASLVACCFMLFCVGRLLYAVGRCCCIRGVLGSLVAGLLASSFGLRGISLALFLALA